MILSVNIFLSTFIYTVFTLEKYPEVAFPKGTVIGNYTYTRGGRKVESYLGLPYAKPPVGDLRFEPPQLADLIVGKYLAQEQPHPCTQPDYMEADSEDCLYLNVYTPKANTNHLLPVYVFLFGGVFFMGENRLYTPKYLLDEDILLVTVNFRVGVLGYLSTSDAVVPGNMGFKDVRCALRWIQINIWRFGGDRSKVTVGGHSSGAIMSHTLLLFSQNEGLFRAGISESGNAWTPMNFVSPQNAKWIYDNIVNITLCPSDSIGLVKCLKTKPSKDFVDIYEEIRDRIFSPSYNPQGVFQFVKHYPVVGPVLEPACVKDRLIKGNPWHYTSSTPFLLGITQKEFLPTFYLVNDGSPANFTYFDATFNKGFLVTSKYQFSSVNGYKVPAAFRQFYLDNKPFSIANLAHSTDGVSDASIIYPSYQGAVRDNSPNTFFYLFNYIGPQTHTTLPPEDRIGAIHVDELYFLFPLQDITIRNTSAADVELSKTLVKFWANFISYLDPTPNPVKGVKWRPFHPHKSYLHIKQNSMQSENNFFPKRMKFWDSQPYPLRDDHYSELPCYPST